MPFAILFLFLWTFGFPAFVASVVCKKSFKKRMKLDQLLRAHGAGATRAESCEELGTYDMRKRYGKLYYHFKPGKIYWMLLILQGKLPSSPLRSSFEEREFLALMPAHGAVPLYVLQVKHRPYMSTVERRIVIREHNLKAKEAEEANAGHEHVRRKLLCIMS